MRWLDTALIPRDFQSLTIPLLSHPTAYKSSQYLSTLIAQDLVRPTESSELDSIFAQTTPPPAADTTASEASSSNEKSNTSATPVEDERMLLLPRQIQLLMDTMEFPEWVRADLRRARLQVEKSLAENKLEELESSAENIHRENKK